LREFGTEDTETPLNTVINDKMTMLKSSHAITEEYARIGCIHGVVYDATDGGPDVIYDYFTEFGKTETSVDFDFATGVDPKLKALEVRQAIGTALGGIPFRSILGLCGATFYANLVNNDVVAEKFTALDPRFGIEQQEGGIRYGDITWRPYPGEIGGDPIIADDKCRFFPLGVPGLFQEVIAPANTIQAVGTLGKRYYAIPQRMKFDMGIEVHTQHNILPLCTRPEVLVEGVDVTV
jgi:hypothetical protein